MPDTKDRPALTERQQAMLDFIVRYHGANGYPPAFREVMDHFSLGSTNAVNCHVQALIRKGYLRPRIPRTSRSLVAI